ncbi:MAG: hypothetical protein ACD_15C00191G0002 [uncultured bacterium]|nr:MAG: hypothetical protein ACD_15C00191G0002 [uncultured bacterium]
MQVLDVVLFLNCSSLTSMQNLLRLVHQHQTKGGRNGKIHGWIVRTFIVIRRIL